MSVLVHSRQVSVVDLINRKRHGEVLSDPEIHALIKGFVDGSVPDYQMSAFAMAVCFTGLNEAETLALTQAMVESGDQYDLSSLERKIVDKHSTGGVGDKVSIAIAPIVAACDVPFAKMSGRGLGHTGGTLDKLESIEGFTVSYTLEEYLKLIGDHGIAIIGQTGNLVPADKQLYALRDVTGTVESIPLIAASVMSKKLAAGADAIVLDVKVGNGAFMKSLKDARTLADTMIAIGEGAGRQVRVIMSDMSAPLGLMVGNALEIREVISYLEGNGPADLHQAVMAAATELLMLSDRDFEDADEARESAEDALASGRAREEFTRWIEAQGGNLAAGLPEAPLTDTVDSPETGVVTKVGALRVGLAAAQLGAGRETKDDEVDHAVGVELHASVGDSVTAGDPLFTIHGRSDIKVQLAREEVMAAFSFDTNEDAESFERVVVLERRGVTS